MPAATAAYVSRLRAVRDPSEHTVRAYSSDLKDYTSFLALRKLCPEQADTVVAYAHHLLIERCAAPRTLRRRMACLRGFYKDQVRAGLLERSPFATLEMQLPLPRSLPRALNRSEASRLAIAARSVCHGPDPDLSKCAMPAGVLLLLSVGLRVSELIALRRSDYDADSGALRVRGKGRRERRVFVVDPNLRAIMASLANRAADGALMSPGDGGWSSQGVRRWLRGFASAAGITRNVTPHMLRHTCATLLLEDGVDLRFLQRLLGHENIATTAIYAHVADAGLRRALEGARLLATLSADAARAC